MNVDAIIRDYAKTDIKVVTRTHPAHWRYYRALGLVVGDTLSHWRVQVYGPCAHWTHVALVRQR